MKILIIQAVSRKDALLVSPVLRVLKSTLDAEVHILVNSELKELFITNPYIDQLHDTNQSLARLRSDIKNLSFDLIIDLRNNWRSKLIRLGNSKRNLVFKSNRFYTWLYVKTKINLLNKKHRVDQYMDLLKSIDVKPDSLGYDFFIPEKDEVENSWLPKSHQGGYAAVAINASHTTKKLPVNRLIELCDRINKPIILIGEPEDIEVAEEIEDFFARGTVEEEAAIEELNKKTIIFNACGKFNFNQSASLIKNANWVFSYDNTMMHIAATFKKRVYTIWGSSTPFFGAYPYRTQFTVFENNNIGCRPCSYNGFANCPKGHFKCMNDLNFDFYLPD